MENLKLIIDELSYIYDIIDDICDNAIFHNYIIDGKYNRSDLLMFIKVVNIINSRYKYTTYDVYDCNKFINVYFTYKYNTEWVGTQYNINEIVESIFNPKYKNHYWDGYRIIDIDWVPQKIKKELKQSIKNVLDECQSIYIKCSSY